VGPFLPFHPLNFLFPHSFQVALRVQKFSISTRRLIFDKMRKGVSKEEVERLVQQERDRHKVVVEQKDEEEGIKMEIKSKTKKKRVIVNLSDGGRIMFSQMDKF